MSFGSSAEPCFCSLGDSSCPQFWLKLRYFILFNGWHLNFVFNWPSQSCCWNSARIVVTTSGDNWQQPHWNQTHFYLRGNFKLALDTETWLMKPGSHHKWGTKVDGALFCARCFRCNDEFYFIPETMLSSSTIQYNSHWSSVAI